MAPLPVRGPQRVGGLASERSGVPGSRQGPRFGPGGGGGERAQMLVLAPVLSVRGTDAGSWGSPACRGPPARCVMLLGLLDENEVLAVFVYNDGSLAERA